MLSIKRTLGSLFSSDQDHQAVQLTVSQHQSRKSLLVIERNIHPNKLKFSFDTQQLALLAHIMTFLCAGGGIQEAGCGAAGGRLVHPQLPGLEVGEAAGKWGQGGGQAGRRQESLQTYGEASG